MVKDCPQGRQQSSAGSMLSLRPLSRNETPQQGKKQRPLAQGRVHVVTQEEVEASKIVISGTLSLCDQKAYVFLTWVICIHLYLRDLYNCMRLDVPFSVATPLKDIVMSTLNCEDRKILIGGYNQMMSLTVLVMYDFDVLIRMEWLRKQRARNNPLLTTRAP